METHTNISTLMDKMIVQLSAEEFCALARYTIEGVLSKASPSSPVKQVVGVTPLSSELGCSSSFIYALKAKGVLDGAIICHIGKKAVFNVDKARELANKFQAEQRSVK